MVSAEVYVYGLHFRAGRLGVLEDFVIKGGSFCYKKQEKIVQRHTAQKKLLFNILLNFLLVFFLRFFKKNMFKTN